MQTRTMRFIDAWVGKPLCWMLTLQNRISMGLRGALTHAAPPQKILFVKLEEQGALVVAVPAIRRAAAMVGSENLYFVTFDENRRILDLMGLVPPENIFQIRSHAYAHLIWDTLRVVWRVRRLGIDATVDMEFFARGSAILTYLCGSRRRVGLHGFDTGGPYRGDLMTHRVFYNPYLHTAIAYEVLVRALEQEPFDIPMLKAPVTSWREELPAFIPSDAANSRVKELLQTHTGTTSTGPRFVFHTNCNDVLRVRKWPEQNYVALAEVLLHDYPNATFILTGLANETAASDALAKQIGDRAISLAGKLSLLELLTLVDHADVLVTNDSGPAHFAGLTRAHLVVLYGPETPALFGPLGKRTRVLYQSFACSPCLTAFNYRLSPCNDNKCMKSIPIEQVREAVTACLEERKSPSTC